jgi:hypothetical protein
MRRNWHGRTITEEWPLVDVTTPHSSIVGDNGLFVFSLANKTVLIMFKFVSAFRETKKTATKWKSFN